jgi:hypothetical protein
MLIIGIPLRFLLVYGLVNRLAESWPEKQCVTLILIFISDSINPNWPAGHWI